MFEKNEKKTIYIVDGYGFIFRAFYAVPNLTAKTGEPIGAVFGFFKMIISLINTEKPDYMVVALDTGKKTFRNRLIEENDAKKIYKEFLQYFSNLNLSFDDIVELSSTELIDKYNISKETIIRLCDKFNLNPLNPPKDLVLALMIGVHEENIEQTYCKDKYKANRRETPDELKSQFKIVRELIDSMNIATESVVGYEADDVIATISQEASNRGYNVVVVSADKDLCQLVKDGKITVFDPSKKILLNEQGVLDKFGVKPEQVCDYLSIVGDHCDNVFGVNGIGPKGAVKLLTKYHDIENIMFHLNELDEKTKQKCVDSKDALEIAQQLISLKYDALTIDNFEKYKLNINSQKLSEFIEKYGFQSIDKSQRQSNFRQKNKVDNDNNKNDNNNNNEPKKQGSLF